MTVDQQDTVLALALELERRGHVRVSTQRKGYRQVERIAALLREAEDLVGQALVIVHRIDEGGRHMLAYLVGREPGAPPAARHAAMQEIRQELLAGAPASYEYGSGKRPSKVKAEMEARAARRAKLKKKSAIKAKRSKSRPSTKKGRTQ